MLFHGNAGNISHRIDYARMFAEARATARCSSIIAATAKAPGQPTEEGTYRDALASWRWLTETRGLAAGEIVIFGESLGGAVACWLAARHTPRALIIASSFTSVPDLGAELYRFLPVRLMSRFKYDTRACLTAVRAPVLIAHSREDDIIPYAHGERLYAAANEPKQFLELRGGHNDGFVFARPEWAAAIGAFLESA